MRPQQVFLCGKLGSRREQINALGGLTYLHDSLSGLRFLADTGAAISVLPHSASPSSASGPALAGADGKGIASWGVVKKSLCFGGRTFTDVPFVLAAVARPILGADFLQRIACWWTPPLTVFLMLCRSCQSAARKEQSARRSSPSFPWCLPLSVSFWPLSRE